LAVRVLGRAVPSRIWTARYRCRDQAIWADPDDRRLFFADLIELERYAADLSTLAANEKRRDIAWRLGFGDDIMKESVRQTELSNWTASLVLT
jgi:hypothetical protein